MVLNFILTAACLYRRENRIYQALTRALIIWVLHIYVWALILSAFKCLTWPALAILYLCADLLMVLWIIKINSHSWNSIGLLHAINEDILNRIQEIKENRFDEFLTCSIVLFVIGLGFVACFAVPYNYDSVDYHAPRICQWVQNRSVFYYASHVTRQNFSSILAGYVATFAYILSGKWQSAMCIIQYGAYVINLGLIMHLCRMFNVSRRLRELAAILWITLPIGFAEAITPQNDQCAAVWLLIFAVELISLIQDIQSGCYAQNGLIEDKRNDLYLRISIIAIAIALSYLTKPAVCFAIVVFLFWYLVVCIRNKISIISLIKQCILAALVIVLLICPQMIQNYMLLGKISADNVGKYQLIGTLSPKYALVNMFKNIIYNFVFKLGPVTNEGTILACANGIANMLRVDLNHPSISEGGIAFRYPSLPCYTCDAGLNFTIYIIALIFLIVFLCSKKTYHKGYIISTYISFVLLCIFLRWESSITRYMIGYFALIIVSVAIVMQYIFTSDFLKRIKVRKVLVILLALMIITDTCYELRDLVRLHPVFPVKSTLTMYNSDIDEYTEACTYINNMGVSTVGLIEGEAPAEYPIWKMLNKGIMIKHVNLDESNPLKSLEEYEIIPEAIISHHDLGDSIICHKRSYISVLSNDCWCVYVQDTEQ